MYNVHQDATYIPLERNGDMMDVRDNLRIPMVSATASKDPNGKIHISMSNVDADNAQEVTIGILRLSRTSIMSQFSSRGM